MAGTKAQWHTIVDAARALGVERKDIPTGEITASSGGDQLKFRSGYRGKKTPKPTTK